MKNIYLLIFVVLQSCYSTAQTFEGSWNGELAIQGQRLPLIFDFTYTNNVWRGVMQSPAQSNVKIPISNIVVVDDSIALEVKAIGLTYHGVKNKNTIDGVFKQGSIQNKLQLHFAEFPPVETKIVKRSQVVLPPYSYDTTAVRIKNTFDNIELAGTLTYPQKKGKYPAVLLLTGSGPQNRDEEVFGHQPFRVLADYLTRNGIVVLRVDDRGVGESTGDFGSSTIENFSKDAISAFNFLKKQPQVDANKVGILGHSEGGLIAVLLAGQHLPGLSFIVSLAGPTFSIDKMMVAQLYAIGKASGMTDDALEQAVKVNEKNFSIVRSNLPTDEAYQQLLKNMASVQIDPNSNKQMERELLTMLAPAYRYFMRIEPEPFIAKIKIPVFAAFGSLDVQVPANVNLKSLHDRLPRNSKSVLKEYEGMNHLFQKAKTGLVPEYSKIEETINPQVMKDIAIWIKGL